MKIIVCPLHDAAAIRRLRRPARVISLLSPSAQGLSDLDDTCLELRFHDIATEREGLTPPCEEHVLRLLAFGDARTSPAPVLVHCWAGVSRSPAAAYILACAAAGQGSEYALATALRTAAPYATPNARMIALADGLLGRDGRMVDAIAGIGRGADTMWGSAFQISIPALQR